MIGNTLRCNFRMNFGYTCVKPFFDNCFFSYIIDTGYRYQVAFQGVLSYTKDQKKPLQM